MASACFDSDISIFLTEPLGTSFNAPVENHCGDIPFAPLKFEVISLTKTAESDIPDTLTIGLSCGVIVCLATVAWSQWKVFMSYIPLYLCLIPVLYWVLKISIAYAYAKLNYSHIQGEVQSVKVRLNNDESTRSESLWKSIVGIVTRLLDDITNKRPQ